MADSNQNYKIVFDAVLNKSSIQRQFDEIGNNPSVKKSAQSIGDIFGKVLKFNLATQAINEFKESLRDSVDAVKELDAAVTEYKKVSDLTGEALDDFIDKAAELGETVARTGAEMVAAATEFKKSGFGDAESLQLAQVASMFQNIADEEISAGDAASFVISQMKAFKIEAKDSQRIIDATNEV